MSQDRRFIVLIGGDLKVQPFADVITWAAFSPQLLPPQGFGPAAKTQEGTLGVPRVYT